jgi:hypothetical protein
VHRVSVGYAPTVIFAGPYESEPKRRAPRVWVSRPEAPRRGRGQPTKYTPERVAAILRDIRAGLFLKAAAAANGISYETLCAWRRENPDFSDAVNEARMLSAATGITVIRAAGRTDWRAEAWYLQHSFPEEFGKARTQLAITGADGGAVEPQVVYRKPPSWEHQVEVARLIVEHHEQMERDRRIVQVEVLEEDEDDGYGPMCPESNGGRIVNGREEHRAP